MKTKRHPWILYVALGLLLIAGLVFLFLYNSRPSADSPRGETVSPTDFVIEPEVAEYLATGPDTKLVLNQDLEARDAVLGDFKSKRTPETKFGYKFEKIDVDTLEFLIQNKFADPRERHNEAPTIGDLYVFMKRWPDTLATGYAKFHENYGGSMVGIDLLEIPAGVHSKQLYEEFEDFTGVNHGYAWWD